MEKTMDYLEYRPRKKVSAIEKLIRWIGDNKAYLITQGICFAVMPAMMHAMMICRGYYAVGGEGILYVAPTVYKLVKWVLSHDESDE